MQNNCRSKCQKSKKIVDWWNQSQCIRIHEIDENSFPSSKIGFEVKTSFEFFQNKGIFEIVPTNLKTFLSQIAQFNKIKSTENKNEIDCHKWYFDKVLLC